MSIMPPGPDRKTSLPPITPACRGGSHAFCHRVTTCMCHCHWPDEDHDGGRIGCNHAGDICSERPWSVTHRERVAQVLLGWAKEIVNHETSRDPYNVADEIAAILADVDG